MRYAGLGFSGLAALPFLWWMTFDPNSTPEARSWRGEYRAQCLSEGRMVLSEDQTFRINSPSLKLPLKGTWSWINDEDWNYVELKLSDGYVVQLFGEPSTARTDYLPFGSDIISCTFTRIPD